MATTGYPLTVGTTTSVSSVTTASISPTANRLILALVGSQQGSGAPVPSLSGNGLTWTEVNHITVGTRALYLFRALSGSTPTPGTVSITFGGSNQTNIGWQFAEFDNVDTTGVNGANAVVQSVTKSQTGTAAGVTVTLAALGSANNATYGAVRNPNNPAITAGSGYTELGQANGATSGDGAYEAEYKAAGSTTVNWTWVLAANNTLAIGVEIKFVAPAAGFTPLLSNLWGSRVVLGT